MSRDSARALFWQVTIPIAATHVKKAGIRITPAEDWSEGNPAVTCASSEIALRCLLPSCHGFVQVVIHLKVQPELRRRSQRAGEIKRGVGADAALAINQLIEASHGPTELAGERALGDFARNEKLFQQHSAGMNRVCRTHRAPNDSPRSAPRERRCPT